MGVVTLFSCSLPLKETLFPVNVTTGFIWHCHSSSRTSGQTFTFSAVRSENTTGSLKPHLILLGSLLNFWIYLTRFPHFALQPPVQSQALHQDQTRFKPPAYPGHRLSTRGRGRCWPALLNSYWVKPTPLITPGAEQERKGLSWREKMTSQ